MSMLMNNRKSRIYDAVLLIVAMGLYLPSLGYDFIGDDLFYFIGNPAIRSFDVLTILKYGATGADYVPLRDLSLAFDYLLWGDQPLGFHLTNVLLYGFTVVAVKHLFTNLNAHLAGGESGRYETPAFLAALLFAIHPSHRDVVCAVYNRGGLLTTLFCALSCIAYLRHLRVRGGGAAAYALAFVFCVLALLSREYGIILPMLLTLPVLFGDRGTAAPRMARLLPFYLVAAVFYVVHRQYAVSAHFIAPDETLLSGVIDKIATAFRIVTFYLVRIVTLFGNFAITEGKLFWAVSFATTTGLLAVFVRVRRAHPQLLFGYLFYLVSLLPVLNLFHTSTVVAIRYSYLPYVGLFFMLTAVPFEGRKRLVHAAALAYTLSWSLATSYQMSYYKSNVSFWENVVPFNKSSVANEQLGYAYHRERQYAKALDALRKVSPARQYPLYYAVIGDSCLNLGDYPCAVEALETAVRLGATDRRTTDLLARAYRGAGETAPPQ